MLIRDARKTYKKDGEDLKHKHMDDLSEIIDEIAKYADNMVDVGYIMKFDVRYSALQKKLNFLAIYVVNWHFSRHILLFPSFFVCPISQFLAAGQIHVKYFSGRGVCLSHLKIMYSNFVFQNLALLYFQVVLFSS